MLFIAAGCAAIALVSAPAPAAADTVGRGAVATAAPTPPLAPPKLTRIVALAVATVPPGKDCNDNANSSSSKRNSNTNDSSGIGRDDNGSNRSSSRSCTNGGFGKHTLRGDIGNIGEGGTRHNKRQLQQQPCHRPYHRAYVRARSRREYTRQSPVLP